jgi:DNA-binding phage protein
MLTPPSPDWLQAAVIARAKTLGLSAIDIAKATGGAVSRQHVHEYLSGRGNMASHKLAAVMAVLGLVVQTSK